MGSNHAKAATITAAAPNQRLAKVGMNISAIIKEKPNTNQCQGSIIQIVSIIAVYSCICSPSNVAQFCSLYYLKNQLPIIIRGDAIAKRLRLAPGDICKITRKTKSAGEIEYYRVCK